MTYPVFSVRDRLAGFSAPELSLNKETMKRTFADRVNNDSHLLFSAADYDLYQIGEFNVDSGEFKAIMPEFVVSGNSVVVGE